MSFKTLSAILRGTWLIQHSYAENQLPIIAAMLEGKLSADHRLGNGGELLRGSGELEQPFAVNGGQRFPLMIFDPQSRRLIENPSIPDGSVGVLPIIGAVTKYSGDCGEAGSIERMGWLNTFMQNPKFAGVMNYIDSPGGQADGTPQFTSAMLGASKPVISYVNGGAYSAGYWFASGGSEIYLGDASDGVGSIGAYTTLLDYRGYFEQKGIKMIEIYPDESKDKNLGYRQALKGDDSLIKADVAQLALNFRSAIAQNRGDRLTSNDWETGKTFDGQDAVDLGLADGIASFDDVIGRITELAADQNKTTVSFSQPNTKTSMSKFTKLASLKGKPAASLTQADIDPINTEIAETEIEGCSLVLDSTLETLQTNAGKVEGLETALSTAQGTITTHEATIASHETSIKEKDAKITALETKLANKPAVDNTNPQADKDKVEGNPDTATFLTSVDKEKAARKAMWG